MNSFCYVVTTVFNIAYLYVMYYCYALQSPLKSLHDDDDDDDDGCCTCVFQFKINCGALQF